MNCKMGGELWAVKIPVASSYLCSLLCLHQARLAGGSIHYFFLSVHSFVHPFVRYLTCEYSILKMTELISVQMGTSGPRD